MSPTGFFQDFQDGEQYNESRNSNNQGQFVTAPSSPKQRHASFFQQPQQQAQQQQQPPSGLYSFTFPTPEQQFQVQLMQRLQSLTGYQAHPYSMMPPTVYHTLPSAIYSIPNTFPQMKTYKSPPATKAGSSIDINVETPNEEIQQGPKLEPPPKKTSVTESPSQKTGVSTPSTSKRKGQEGSSSSSSVPVPISKVQSFLQAPKTPVLSPKSSYQNAFASALSSIMTLRDSGKNKNQSQSNGPPFITRSTSEKVSNRSELMDQVQRTAWARQTK